MLFYLVVLFLLKEGKWMSKSLDCKSKKSLDSVKKIMARNRKRVKKNCSANIEGKDPKKVTILPTGIWESSKLE